MDGVQQAAIAQNFTFTPANVIPGFPNADAEAPHLARSGDNVFVVWHEISDPNVATPQPDVLLARSGDRGQTFLPRVNLSNSPMEFSGDEAVAATRSGNATRVYVVWQEGGAVLFRRDRTNDGTFANAVTINDTLGRSAHEPIQMLASGDNVFVVWVSDNPQPGDNTDVFFARSTDAGSTFKDKKNLSNSAGESKNPQLAFTADNRVIVAWQDNTATGNFDLLYVRGQ